MNPMEAAACQLLNLAAHLKTGTSEPDLAALRDRIVRQLKEFEDEAHRAGYGSDVVRYAHYTLCTFLDEAVLGTPWGGRSRWHENSLLSQFHRETWGGEQVFNIIEKSKRNASANIDLLEFLYVVLGLGFEGAYGAVSDGREQLGRVRDSLYDAIRNQRPERDHDLSLNWRGSNAGKPGLTNFLPPWAIASIAAALMLVAFVSFSWALNRASDPLLSRMATFDAEALARLELAARGPSREAESLWVTLERLLADDIQAGKILLERDGRQVTLRLAGDGLFASASPRVEPELVPTIERIADALAQVGGQVLVTGHSDNLPIRSVRFPSNWHLSEARAESVARILMAPSPDPALFRHEGRADTQPLADNATPEGRARNRRVDISVTAMTGEDV
jgi:type VI secretion system protein ImpK